jgi:hypothetical protein
MRALVIGMMAIAVVGVGTGCFDETLSPPSLLIANDTSGSVVVTTDPPSPVEGAEVEIGPGGSSYISVRLDDDDCTDEDVVVSDADTGEEIHRVDAGFCLVEGGRPQNTVTIRD